MNILSGFFSLLSFSLQRKIHVQEYYSRVNYYIDIYNLEVIIKKRWFLRGFSWKIMNLTGISKSDHKLAHKGVSDTLLTAELVTQDILDSKYRKY